MKYIKFRLYSVKTAFLKCVETLAVLSLLDNTAGGVSFLQGEVQQVGACWQVGEVEAVGVGEVCHKAACVVEDIHPF